MDDRDKGVFAKLKELFGPDVEVIDLSTPAAQEQAGVRPAPSDVPVAEGEAIVTVKVYRQDTIVQCPSHGLEKQPGWRFDVHSDPRARATKEGGVYALEAYISLTSALLEALHRERIVLAIEGEVQDPISVAMTSSAHSKE